MIKKVGNIALWTLLFGGVLLLVSFESRQYKRAVVSDISIAIQAVYGGHFITVDDVEALLIAQYPGLTATFVQEVDLDALEQQLLEYPSVKSVQAYCTPDGHLHLKIDQRQPVLRFFDAGKQFYLDTEGARFPLSPNFSVAVPIVTGSWQTPEHIEEVFQLWTAIADRPILKDLIAGMERTDNGTYWLYPSKGTHKVYLGDTSQLEKRLTKLVHFYQNAMDDELDKKTKWIDLTYKNQVIVKK